jgi:branched-chain amino acid transport system permease protein
MSERGAALGRVLLPSAAVLGVMLAGSTLSTYWQYVFTMSIGAMVIGVALIMLVGYARCITLASGAMMAIGAYASVVAVLHFGIPFPLAVLIATCFGAIGGFVLAVPAVRFRSHNLAMVTMVFQAVAIILLREAKAWTGGAEGVHVPPPVLFGTILKSDLANLLLTGCAAVVAILPMTVLLYGPFGKNLRALAANEVGARAFAINPRSYLIAAFVVSSAAIAFAGALSAPRFRIIDPETFGLLASIFMLAYPIIGGMQSIWGGLLGGGLLRFLPEVLRPLADYMELIFCVLVVVTVMFFPGGFVDLAGRIAGRVRGKAPAAKGEASPADTTGARDAMVRAMPAAAGSPRGDSDAPALRIEGLSKSYGALQAVSGVSIDVTAGRLHGLMGPNGAGKTTLFNMVFGFTRPDAGRVSSFGRDIGVVPVEGRLALGITRTFQHVAIFPSLTCMDNVVIGLGRNAVGTSMGRSLDSALALRAAGEERDAVIAALDAVGLKSLALQLAGSLSLGNQRRLEIARAIVSRPRIILLDEPVSGVGHDEIGGLRELLLAINKELGVTMLVIEHNIGFLLSLCDRLTVMSHGKIIEEGKPKEVVAAQHVRSAYFGDKAAA